MQCYAIVISMFGPPSMFELSRNMTVYPKAFPCKMSVSCDGKTNVHRCMQLCVGLQLDNNA